MKRTTIAAIGLAAALVAIPTVMAAAQPDQSDQTATTCPYHGEGIDHQTMHNQMAGMMAMMSSTGMMGIGPGGMNGMNGTNGTNCRPAR